jgi:NAD(P)-dependent dehydrogenase (short-subunit alcohol dehydrogenase family)
MSRVLVVTGASRGIGACCARIGAREGWQVVVNYGRSREAALSVVAEIERAGGAAIAVGADVAHPEEVERLFAEADRHFGPVTALINNAGVTGALCRVEDQTEENLAALFATNVHAYFHCARAAIRRMSPRHGGSGGAIVNISSVAARLGGVPQMVAYAASKGAIDSFTVGLAKEVGADGIRVNAIRPGAIDTDILAPMGGTALVQRLAASIPIGRGGRPEEVGEAAVWLLSPAASYVHGAILDVSGGR